MQLGEAFCGMYYHPIFPDRNCYLAREEDGTFPCPSLNYPHCFSFDKLCLA